MTASVRCASHENTWLLGYTVGEAGIHRSLLSSRHMFTFISTTLHTAKANKNENHLILKILSEK